MKNKIIKFVKKQFLVIWTIAVLIILASMSAYALYESKYSTMNRVVVASSSEKMLFSSNILEADEDTVYRGIYRPELSAEAKATGYYEVDVYLYNYDISNSVKKYPETINYNIQIALTNIKGEVLSQAAVGSKEIQIVYETENGTATKTLSGSNLTDTISGQSLIANASSTSEKKYTIRFPGTWNLDEDTDICVQMVTVLDKGGVLDKYNDLKNLGQVIGIRRSANSESKGWQAYIKEIREEKDADDCDGYNLVVTGSGQAKIVIEWDSTRFDFNKYFSNKDSNLYNFGEVTYTEATGDNAWSKLEINANTGSDATGHRNRYDIQLYKTGAYDPDDWSFFVDLTDEEVTAADINAAYVKVNVTMQTEQ